MNIFFTCKNSLVILLQIYRFLVLVVKKRPQYRFKLKCFFIQLQIKYLIRRHSIFSILPLDDDENDSSDENMLKSVNKQTQRRSTGYPGLEINSGSSDGEVVM